MEAKTGATTEATIEATTETTTQEEKSKKRARRNRTLFLTEEDRIRLKPKLITDKPEEKLSADLPQGTINGDCLEWAEVLPSKSVDLLFLDPPYNLSKNFNGRNFAKTDVNTYSKWLDNVVRTLNHLLKDSASIYICGDWYSSTSIYEVASEHFYVQNRITWEREKGRGALGNWKNSSEDIWFCTKSKNYTFNVDKVKLRRKVIAPYKENGKPKDWQDTETGKFRDTHPSNLWTDITIPFWSMPENTDHPTQKSEKLLAKIILASSNQGDFVLDPFVGSGTTSVVAKKLGRRYLGIELDAEYAMLTERRLELAELDQEIQGYQEGVFWERNSLSLQGKGDKEKSKRIKSSDDNSNNSDSDDKVRDNSNKNNSKGKRNSKTKRVELALFE
ncbi:site-specific DNA-methyltransferase [Heliorestis acidaminivorans]|uniref:Methyltransferase n=1 Tax=Heliorestis acidaminivorans TaxID=553427 RepID=A0A6I0F166_9FIRM|nr:DNA methyltransferase [Heliorestis acidaminivorans]KAB2952927.1 site-specific DNA-methyltransferase [Heliorestis acidaminivorans]